MSFSRIFLEEKTKMLKFNDLYTDEFRGENKNEKENYFFGKPYRKRKTI